MSGLKLGHKKAILIGSGLLLFLLTFLLVFQKNQETLTMVEMQSLQAKNRVNFLSTLQLQVNSMRDTMPEVKRETEEYLSHFPSVVTQQKAIDNVYRMMQDSGIRVTSVKPGNEVTFFQGGNIVGVGDTADQQNAGGQNDSTQQATLSAVEADPEQKVNSLDEMVGKFMTYEVDVTGSMNKIMNALDWVADNEENMNVTAVNLTFDQSTGKLTGTMQLNYFYMNGNGVPYEEPDISGISFGTKNVFGTFNKKKKKK